MRQAVFEEARVSACDHVVLLVPGRWVRRSFNESGKGNDHAESQAVASAVVTYCCLSYAVCQRVETPGLNGVVIAQETTQHECVPQLRSRQGADGGTLHSRYAPPRACAASAETQPIPFEHRSQNAMTDGWASY